MAVYSTAVFLSTTVYFGLICRMISDRFNKLTELILKMADGTVTMEHLYYIHNLHQKLCDVVLEADDLFRGFLFINFITLLPEMCGSLYIYMFHSQELEEEARKALLTFAIDDFIHYLILCVDASRIPTSAHGCYDFLSHLSSKLENDEQQAKIALMLERLSGPTIGITCLDLFVITKGTIVNEGQELRLGTRQLGDGQVDDSQWAIVIWAMET
ncbi:uncharacterized protein LOC111629903 [Centruroides sculpturatus]|uniref:uncharacterized protein LOC111629903 n=1 Tax=Centruroides sculpturatus TaxID=218467 RepID=UPI000C6D5413|nr:uncharacterized protein LOC111629903 [Centruroides sculpturatus]